VNKLLSEETRSFIRQRFCHLDEEKEVAQVRKLADEILEIAREDSWDQRSGKLSKYRVNDASSFYYNLATVTIEYPEMMTQVFDYILEGMKDELEKKKESYERVHTFFSSKLGIDDRLIADFIFQLVQNIRSKFTYATERSGLVGETIEKLKLHLEQLF
jgi:hypothetical protein